MNCVFTNGLCIYCGFKTPVIDAKRNCPKRHNAPQPRMKRNIECRWITNQQRMQDILQLIGKLPPDISGVAGVPRSGMMPAGMIAEILHLPLYSIHKTTGLVELPHGWRLSARQDGNILVVDDTICSGKAMIELGKVLDFPHYTAVIYCTPQNTELTDFYSVLLPTPHYLEWNFFNSVYAANLALDFDGIICEDGSGLPKYLPRKYPIKLICTGRLEKSREKTEAWLQQFNVECERLEMWPGEENKRWIDHGVAQWKGEIFKESQSPIFVESCPLQSKVIGDIVTGTGKKVICPTSSEIWV